MRISTLLGGFVVALAAACGGGGSGDDDDDAAIDARPFDAPQPDAFVPTSCTPVGGTPALGTVTVASDLDMPVFATAPRNDPRLFILEKGTGEIKILKDGAVLPTPFVDVPIGSGVNSLDDERGLLGMAFPPDYATTGFFYVFFVNGNGDEEISRYQVSADPDIADASTKTLVWDNNDFAGNHNGGTIAFGSDGYLYFGMGDGGNADDGMNYGQNINVLFGKMNRIDVSTLPYTSPAGNPFIGVTGADEIWDWGLRNPYRWSFDRETGDMYIGDVGQYEWEEIDIEAAGTGNKNYGWRQLEGTHCFNPSSGCDTTGKTPPAYEYDHSGECAVVGGYVYRGACMPGWQGTYFFSDYCGGWVRSTVWNGTDITTPVDQAGLAAGGDIVSFGEDGYGELYIVRHDTGIVQKIVAAP